MKIYKNYLISIIFFVILVVLFWLLINTISLKHLRLRYMKINNGQIISVNQLNLTKNVVVEDVKLKNLSSPFNIEVSPSGKFIANWITTEFTKTILGEQRTKMELIFLKNDLKTLYWRPQIDVTRYDLSQFEAKTSEYFPNKALWDPTSTFFLTRSVKQDENNEYLLLNVKERKIVYLAEIISDLQFVDFSFSNNGKYLVVYHTNQNKLVLINLENMDVVENFVIPETYQYNGICAISWKSDDEMFAFKVGCGNLLEPSNKDLFIFQISTRNYIKIPTIRDDDSCAFYVPGGQFLLEHIQGHDLIVYYLFGDYNYFHDDVNCQVENVKEQDGLVIQDIRSNEFVYLPKKTIVSSNLQKALLGQKTISSDGLFLIYTLNGNTGSDAFEIETVELSVLYKNFSVKTTSKKLINHELFDKKIYLSNDKQYLIAQNCCNQIGFSIWRFVNNSWVKIKDEPSSIFIGWEE